MIKFVAKVAIAAAVALGTMGGLTAEANAAQVDIIIKKPVRKPVVVVRPVVRRPVVVVRPVVRRPVVVVRPVVRRPVVVVRPVVRRPVVVVQPVVRRPVVVVPVGRCTQALALTKASNAGLNRAAVSFVGPNRISVSGTARGVWMRMDFANVAGCPRL